MRTIVSPIPLAQTLPRWRLTGLRTAIGLIGAIIAVLVVTVAVGAGETRFADELRTWGTSACYLLAAVVVALRVLSRPESRGPWLVIAVGVSLYGIGNVVWELWLGELEQPQIPSIADALWLALYPAAYVGMLWLARDAWRRVKVSVWVDGMIAGLGLAAVGAAIVFPPVLDAATGDTKAVATNLAYPIGDLILAALVMAIFAIRDWRLDRAWTMLGAGFLSLTVADSLYLLHVASGSFQSSNIANVFFLAGVALIALAAWQPPPQVERPRLEDWSVLLIPAIAVMVALVLLSLEHEHELGPVARTLALLTITCGFVRAFLSFRDLRTLAETRMLSLTDDLTALPNRRLLLRRLRSAVAEAEAVDGSCALLILDLNQFKELNDTLGHAAGDDLLRQIGPRLRTALRGTDTLARLGGDEFGLVIPAPVDAASAMAIADKLRATLAAPFVVEGLSLYVDASIGVALFPQHGDSEIELLRLADVALYQAKRTRAGHELYDCHRDNHSLERLSLAGELKTALAGDQIHVVFQPKADAGGGIAGFEALARWQHPARGEIQPDDFVPMIEQIGLSRALTARVLDLALAQCRTWHDAGEHVHVAVNATVADLLDLGFPDQVAAAIERHDLPAGMLVIEITEGSVLTDPDRISLVLARLKETGVSLSLDDFGTGYSSLTHLRSLPVDEVKIDRSFVSNMESDPKDLAIVLATIKLADALGIRVVAEGVEDLRTWQRLSEAGCGLIQGYVVSPPVSSSAATALLTAPHGVGQVA